MDCLNCGAPLPTDSEVCAHCHSRNDVDLRALESAVESGDPTDMDCPRCRQRLVSIVLRYEGRLVIERCKQCLGIFFNPGELEAVIEKSTENAYEIHRDKLRHLAEQAPTTHFDEVKYIKCPACGELMHRKVFGARSGIIVDRCRDHGVWLDGGELNRIFNWVRAGGQLHDQFEREQRARAQARAEHRAVFSQHSSLTNPNFETSASRYDFGGVLRLVSRMLT